MLGCRLVRAVELGIARVGVVGEKRWRVAREEVAKQESVGLDFHSQDPHGNAQKNQDHWGDQPQARRSEQDRKARRSMQRVVTRQRPPFKFDLSSLRVSRPNANP